MSDDTPTKPRSKNLRRSLRHWHRDIGYFFSGLLIIYSISGIALNHRAEWNPRRYVVESQEVDTGFVQSGDSVVREQAEALARQFAPGRDFRDFDVPSRKPDELRIYLNDARLAVDLTSGKGELEIFENRPLLGEMVFLHQTTESAWIWFADIFGLGMLFIAVSGLSMLAGSTGFIWRGAVLTVLGLLFPIAILIFYFS